jgi:rhodanese-related sulfurtransferase
MILHSITRGFDGLPPKAGFENFFLFFLINSREVSALPIEITPAEVKQLMDRGFPMQLIDVREQAEHDICRIEGATLIPMRSIPDHLNELSGEEKAMVFFCHHGVRSMSVVDWLQRQGVENCRSMLGGIDLWSVEIDTAVPRY